MSCIFLDYKIFFNLENNFNNIVKIILKIPELDLSTNILLEKIENLKATKGRVNFKILNNFFQFNLIKEKTNDDNFKVAEIDSSNFAKDLQKEKVKEGFGNLKIALKKYFQAKDIRVNTEIIDACKDYNLADQIAMICPLDSEEKQLLLETLSITKRNALLLSIIESYTSEANISEVIKH